MRLNGWWLIGILIVGLWVEMMGGERISRISPEHAGMDPQRLAMIEPAIMKAIREGELPGAVVVVGRDQAIVYQKAFGRRNIYQGADEKMTLETIFDMASVSKSVSTASAVWKLVEDGKLRLWDRVRNYIPEFTGYQDSSSHEEFAPQIIHLLTHSSGLIPYLNAKSLQERHPVMNLDTLIAEIARSPKRSRPGSEFVYSCLGYITLGYIVQKVSGQDLNQFNQDHLFKPLQMAHSGYNPPQQFQAMIAPTEAIDGHLLRGVVHDPLARLIGGVSGNAGLFSTAQDLSVFVMMLLNHGEYRGTRVFSPMTVQRMTQLYLPLPHLGRTPGWDTGTDYSSPRGDIFGYQSFGHTGYTGTSLWIDPESKVFVLLLSNRVHPEDKGSLVALRGILGNIVASSIIKL